MNYFLEKNRQAEAMLATKPIRASGKAAAKNKIVTKYIPDGKYINNRKKVACMVLNKRNFGGRYLQISFFGKAFK